MLKIEKLGKITNLLAKKCAPKAVSTAIEVKESFQKRPKESEDIDEIIERLMREKAEIEDIAKQREKARAAKDNLEFIAGKEAALEWTKKAHYQDIIRFKRPQGQMAAPMIDLSLLERIQHAHNKGQKWSEGWLEGVREFWDEVESEL